MAGLETGSLNAVEPTTSSVVETVGSGTRLFTWSRALTGGILAFAALGLSRELALDSAVQPVIRATATLLPGNS